MMKRLMWWRWNISRASPVWWTPASQWPSQFTQIHTTPAWSVSTSPFTSNSTTMPPALLTVILKKSRPAKRSGKKPCSHDWLPHLKPQKEKVHYLPPQSLPSLRLSLLPQHIHPTTSNPNHPARRVRTVRTQTSGRRTTSWSAKDAMTYARVFWPYGMRSQAWLIVQRRPKLWSWLRQQNIFVRCMSATNKGPRRRSSWKASNSSYYGDSRNWNVHKCWLVQPCFQ